MAIVSELAKAAARERIEQIKRKLEDEQNKRLSFQATQGGALLGNAVELLPQVAQSMLRTGVQIKEDRDAALQKEIDKAVAVGDVSSLQSLFDEQAKEKSENEYTETEDEELQVAKEPSLLDGLFRSPKVDKVDLAKAQMVQDAIGLARSKEQAELAKLGAETNKIRAEEGKAVADSQKSLAEANAKLIEARQLVGPQNVPVKPISQLTPDEVQKFIVDWKEQGFAGDVIEKTIDALYQSDLKKAELAGDAAKVDELKSQINLQKAQTAKTYADITRGKEESARQDKQLAINATKAVSGVDIKPIERLDRETLTARLAAAEKAKHLINLINKADPSTVFNGATAFTNAMKEGLNNPAIGVDSLLGNAMNAVRSDRSKEIIRETKQLAQMIGKAREGGKLTDADLKFYLENLVNVGTDSPGDFLNALYTLADGAVDDYNRQRNTLLSSGATAMDEFPVMAELPPYAPSYVKESQKAQELENKSLEVIGQMEPDTAADIVRKIDKKFSKPEERLEAYKKVVQAQKDGDSFLRIGTLVIKL